MSEYCLMSAPLGALYTVDARYADAQVRGGAQLVSRHPTLDEASAASLRLQLAQSQRVRDDAAALGGKRLLAHIIAVTIAYDDGARRAQFHLTTPSGGVLVQDFKLSDPPALLRELSRMTNISAPGVKLLPVAIPVTLRRLDAVVRCDDAVAPWRVIGVRSLHCLPVNELRPSDVLLLDGRHWLIRDRVEDGVIVTPFTGGMARLRPDETPRLIALAADQRYAVERQLYHFGAHELAQIATRQSATLVS